MSCVCVRECVFVIFNLPQRKLPCVWSEGWGVWSLCLVLISMAWNELHVPPLCFYFFRWCMLWSNGPKIIPLHYWNVCVCVCVCVCVSWLHFRSDCLPTDVPAALETEISVKEKKSHHCNHFLLIHHTGNWSSSALHCRTQYSMLLWLYTILRSM